MANHTFRRYGFGIAKLLGASIAALATVIAVVNFEGNIHEVEPGQVYRSGQLSGSQLHELVQQRGIKTILNLRGPNQGKSWYDGEVRVARDDHVAHIDYALSARHEVAPDQMRDLVRIVREAPKPLLVHCSAGADRTGLVSALYELERRQPPETAAKQLSIVYGHFPWLGSKTIAMDQSFAQYVATHHRTAGTQEVDARTSYPAQAASASSAAGTN